MSLAVIDPLQVPGPTLSYLDHSGFCIFRCDAISSEPCHSFRQQCCHRNIVKWTVKYHSCKSSSSRHSAFLKLELQFPRPVWVFTVQFWGARFQVCGTYIVHKSQWRLLYLKSYHLELRTEVCASVCQCALQNSEFLPIVCSCSGWLSSLRSPERFLSFQCK